MVARIFPCEAAITRLVAALLPERQGEGAVQAAQRDRLTSNRPMPENGPIKGQLHRGPGTRSDAVGGCGTGSGVISRIVRPIDFRDRAIGA
jgi:hypothetical protein